MNVNVDAKNIGDIIKSLPYKAILLIISITSALLIFLPDAALKKMFLLDFRNTIGTFLGVIFLSSSCLTMYLFISIIYRNRRVNKELSGKKAKQKIEGLSDNEKQVIAYMYHNQDKNIFLPPTSSSIVHLKSLIMISEASNMGPLVVAVQLLPFFLQQWVVRTLVEYPELLQNVPNCLPHEYQKYMDYVDS